MTTVPYLVYKETTLPATLTAHSIYLIAPPSHPDYLEIYVTNAAGDATRHIPTVADIQDMIDASLAMQGSTRVVADIAARDALTGLPEGATVLVTDATDDASVASGAATYVWGGAAWVKISEAESLDVALEWASIIGKPASTPAQIDAAVSNSHTHANKTQLDKIGEDARGNLTYSGSLPATGWSSTGW